MVGPYLDNPFSFETAGLDYAVPLGADGHVSVTSPTEGRFPAGAVMGDMTYDLAGVTQAGEIDEKYIVDPLPVSAPVPPHPAPAMSMPTSVGMTTDNVDALTAPDLLAAGAGQWDDVLAARQAALDLQRELEKTVKQRDEAQMALSTLRNELYAARQVEKRLRGERDEARNQVAFLRRDRAAAKLTESRLRKERDQARLAAVLGKGKSKKWSPGPTGTGRGNEDLKLVLGEESGGENTDWVELMGDRAAADFTADTLVSPALCSPFEEIFGLQVDKT
ncbi:hypothetical protein QBC47DRAFT_48843 [Echria macrotheca]|uniref:Uncharacterized protein n=1 Tax=Echria macrotheca TaxID=438768 RepID=A0AAJ0B705_9PEZI|nr:hypothetical protein QBC47DRAFT_48843 [Echria macrotheca]